jgi:uncharacterized protein
MPGEGTPGEGTPGERAPGEGTPVEGTPGEGTPRDRDPSGRPRNARPRDGLGRPLARNAGQQRTGADQNQADWDQADWDQADRVDRIPDDLVITGRDAAVLADRLIRADRPFHAHEVLESAWKTGPPGERELWQGLAQIAVGLTHARRGNARGAITLLRRGTQRIQTYQGHPASPLDPSTTADPSAPGGPGPSGRDPHPYGMDIPATLAAAEDLATRIEQHGLDQILPADLTLRLLTGAM